MAEDRFLDDFRVGEKSVSGGVTITESEIIHFALQDDPQSFHLDVTAAEKSPYGGLIASGFHTLSLCFRLFMQRGVLAACSIGSPGIDEVRWLARGRARGPRAAEAEGRVGDWFGVWKVFLEPPPRILRKVLAAPPLRPIPCGIEAPQRLANQEELPLIPRAPLAYADVEAQPDPLADGHGW